MEEEVEERKRDINQIRQTVSVPSKLDREVPLVPSQHPLPIVKKKFQRPLHFGGHSICDLFVRGALFAKSSDPLDPFKFLCGRESSRASDLRIDIG